MKWIVNPYLIDKMRGSSFSVIQFTREYFDDAWDHLYARYHRTDAFLINVDDVDHICDFATDVLFIKKGFDPQNGPFITYGRLRNKNGQHILTTSENYITLITFDSSPLTGKSDAYLLFVKVEEDDDMKDIDIETHESDEEDEKSYDVYVPDTKIRGLIQSKITYSFDVSKLTIGHPYRIRFLSDIDIFDKYYKYNDEIYGILAEATEEDLKFATIHDNVTNIGSGISAAFQLKPDMKFELDKLV